MSRPVLIIEAGRSLVKAGVFSRADDQPLAFVTEPLAGEEDFRAALSRVQAVLRDKGYESFDKVYLGIPPSEISLRVLRLPFDEKKKIDEVLPFELGGTLPMDVEEAVFESILLGDGGDEGGGARVLAIAVDKAVLSAYIDALSGVGLDPAWIGSTLFSMPGLLKDIYKTDAVTAYICKDFISVSRSGKPLFFNSIYGVEALKLSLGYLAKEGITIEEAYWEGVPGDKLKALFPGASVNEALKLPGEFGNESATVFALAGDIARGLEPGGINLRKGDLEYTRERVRARGKLRLTFALAVIILGLFTGDVYLRYMKKSGELSAYRESLKSSYLELFPNERGKVADELYMLKAKLKRLDDESVLVGRGVSALEVLGLLTKAGAGITIHEASIGEGRIKARGTAASFDAANSYKEALGKVSAFRDVQVTDVKSKAGSGVVFSLTIIM
jgi:type II secretory pathway component PulL